MRGKPSQTEIDRVVDEDFSFNYYSSTTPGNTSSDVHVRHAEENEAQEDALYAAYDTMLPSEEQPQLD